MYATTPPGGGSSPCGLPVWDETAAIHAADGDASLAHRLVAALIDALPADLADLHSCAGRNDHAALAETAHHLRGATRYCGVLALDAALYDLEQAAKAGRAGDIATRLTRVDGESARLTEAFC
jgi:HPt (histidine-containing phosphotransfer) domain-containing protein